MIKWKKISNVLYVSEDGNLHIEREESRLYGLCWVVCVKNGSYYEIRKRVYTVKDAKTFAETLV